MAREGAMVRLMGGPEDEEDKKGPQHSDLIAGLYLRDKTVLIGYKRMVYTEPEEEKPQEESQPTMMGGMMMAPPSEPPKKKPKEPEFNNLEDDIIHQYVLARSFNQGQYLGESIYDGIGGEELSAVVGVAADHKNDQDNLLLNLRSVLSQQIDFTGLTRNALFKAAEDISKFMGKLSRYNENVLINRLPRYDAIVLDGTGEMYEIKAQDERDAGKTTYTQGVEARLNDSMGLVNGKRGTEKLPKEALMVVGRGAKQVRGNLKKKLYETNADGSLKYSLDEGIVAVLMAIQDENTFMKKRARKIEEYEAGEIEVWVVDRQSYDDCKANGFEAKQLRPDEVLEYIKKVPPLMMPPPEDDKKSEKKEDKKTQTPWCGG